MPTLSDDLRAARLLIVDDEELNVRLLRHTLDRAGFTAVRSTTDSREVVRLVGESEPDLILLDLRMPHLDGFEVLKRVAEMVPAGSHLPILVLTADITPEAKRRALASGASDFVLKPIDITEVGLRVRNLLRTRFLNRDLDGQVRARTRDLEAARLETVERLALAAEYRDDATGQHTRRVARTAGLLASALGLSADEAELIGQAAPLHDVGKIGVPDLILLKPGRLTPAEFDIIQGHTLIGGRILSGAQFPLLQAAERIALTHHERWDGAGYPGGLAGADIPLAGRVVAVADVFDALTHARPYKPAWPLAAAVAEVRRASGAQFDPAVVAAFLGLPHAELV